MNKGRSRMFSQKMKGVFKSRSRLDSNSKNSLERETNLEFEEKPLETNANNKIPNPTSTFPNCDSSRFVCTTSGNQYDHLGRGIGANLADNHNGREWRTKGKEVFQDFNESSPGADGFGGLSYKNELLKKKNVINESCQFCHHDLSLNRKTSNMSYEQESLFQRTRLEELNLNNNNNSMWKRRTSDSSDPGICHYCLKQICSCGNSNLILVNNNNITKTNRPKLNDSSYFSPVLQYAFGEEKTNRNDFSILALGIHQYIREVFNELDSANKGYVHYEDLQILCTILGKDLKNLSKSNINTSCEVDKTNEYNLCANNSCETHLHFGKFSQIICDTFSDFTDNNCLEKRKNTQLVNAVVNITRRNESLNIISNQLEKLENDYLKFKKNSSNSVYGNSEGKNNECNRLSKDNSKGNMNGDTSYLENLKLQQIILQQQQELQCLREVIEDLRVSLQCSDAENLSLKVQEVKMKQFSIMSSSEEEMRTDLSPTDDEGDSIDKIILNFPSSEQLKMNSNDSLLLSMESLNLSTASRTSPPPQMNDKVVAPNQNQLTFKTFQKEEDETYLSVTKEMENVYQKLSETRQELEATRTDLESTVTEIQNKGFQIDRLNTSLKEAKTNLKESETENATLKERLVSWGREQDSKRIRTDEIEKELLGLKADLVKKDQEILRLSNQLKDIRVKRNKDIENLSTARTIIANSLVEAKRNEEKLNRLTKSGIHGLGLLGQGELPPKPSLNCFGCDGNNNNTYKYMPQNLTNKRHTDLFNKFNTALNVKCNNNILNCRSNLTNRSSQHNSSIVSCSEGKRQSEEHYRLNPSPCELRRSEFGRVGNWTELEKEEGVTPSSSDVIKCLSNTVPLKKGLRIHDVRVTSSLSPAPASSFHSEEKPTLEVKPTVTKPIPPMKPLPRPTMKPTIKPLYEATQVLLREESPLNLEPRKGVGGERWKPPLECHSKTSTQILEGLEAEVEFLRKTLEDDPIWG